MNTSVKLKINIVFFVLKKADNQVILKDRNNIIDNNLHKGITSEKSNK